MPPPSTALAWRGRLAVWAYRALDGLTARVPRRLAPIICLMGGWLWYLAAPGQRRAVRRNLRQVLGREPSPWLVRQVFWHGALNYWDTFIGGHLTREQLLRLFDVGGLENVDAALAEGHGAVMFSAHLGSIALGGVWFGARGYTASIVVETLEPPELMDLFMARRSGGFVRVLPATTSVLRDLLRVVRHNEVVGLITDRDVLGSGIEVQFFGRTTRFPAGVAALALRTGAQVLPCFVLHTSTGQLYGWVDGPLPRPNTGSFEEDVKLLTQEVANCLAYHIRHHPEQWTVFQERWPDDARPHADR